MKLVIFDLDGTLVDTLQDLANSANYALREHGFPEHETEAYKLFVGNGIHLLITRALPPAFRDEATVLRVKAAFVAHYEKHGRDLSAPYPGIVELLHGLQRAGIRISVASNKYHAATVEIVAFYFPAIKFDLVLGHRDGHPAKPDPDIVFDTLDTLHIAAGDCLYVGDSSVDMQTANRAGVRAVGVTWGFRSEVELLESGAQHIVHYPTEILSLCR